LELAKWDNSLAKLHRWRFNTFSIAFLSVSPSPHGTRTFPSSPRNAKLSLEQLPAIPDLPKAPESWRRLLALHRELSGLSANRIYFLSYRDAAEVSRGLTHQSAHTITAALVTIGAIEIVAKGKAGSNSRKPAEFRYLQSEGDNEAQADHDGEVQI
jgi:hypothetical protein